MVEESKDSILSMSIEMDENNVIDPNNRSAVSYGETVLCTEESLLRLPDNFYQIWKQYEQGLLFPVEPNTVESLLQKWFQNEPIDQFSTLSNSSNHGQLPGIDQKRRRVDSEF